jgi:hypothetical protein
VDALEQLLRQLVHRIVTLSASSVYALLSVPISLAQMNELLEELIIGARAAQFLLAQPNETVWSQCLQTQSLPTSADPCFHLAVHAFTCAVAVDQTFLLHQSLVTVLRCLSDMIPAPAGPTPPAADGKGGCEGGDMMSSWKSIVHHASSSPGGTGAAHTAIADVLARAPGNVLDAASYLYRVVVRERPHVFEEEGDEERAVRVKLLFLCQVLATTGTDGTTGTDDGYHLLKHHMSWLQRMVCTTLWVTRSVKAKRVKQPLTFPIAHCAVTTVADFVDSLPSFRVLVMHASPLTTPLRVGAPFVMTPHCEPALHALDFTAAPAALINELGASRSNSDSLDSPYHPCGALSCTRLLRSLPTEVAGAPLSSALCELATRFVATRLVLPWHYDRCPNTWAGLAPTRPTILLLGVEHSRFFGLHHAPLHIPGWTADLVKKASLFCQSLAIVAHRLVTCVGQLGALLKECVLDPASSPFFLSAVDSAKEAPVPALPNYVYPFLIDPTATETALLQSAADGHCLVPSLLASLACTIALLDATLCAKALEALSGVLVHLEGVFKMPLEVAHAQEHSGNTPGSLNALTLIFLQGFLQRAMERSAPPPPTQEASASASLGGRSGRVHWEVDGYQTLWKLIRTALCEDHENYHASSKKPSKADKAARESAAKWEEAVTACCRRRRAASGPSQGGATGSASVNEAAAAFRALQSAEAALLRALAQKLPGMYYGIVHALALLHIAGEQLMVRGVELVLCVFTITEGGCSRQRYRGLGSTAHPSERRWQLDVNLCHSFVGAEKTMPHWSPGCIRRSSESVLLPCTASVVPYDSTELSPLPACCARHGWAFGAASRFVLGQSLILGQSLTTPCVTTCSSRAGIYVLYTTVPIRPPPPLPRIPTPRPQAWPGARSVLAKYAPYHLLGNDVPAFMRYVAAHRTVSVDQLAFDMEFGCGAVAKFAIDGQCSASNCDFSGGTPLLLLLSRPVGDHHVVGTSPSDLLSRPVGDHHVVGTSPSDLSALLSSAVATVLCSVHITAAAPAASSSSSAGKAAPAASSSSSAGKAAAPAASSSSSAGKAAPAASSSSSVGKQPVGKAVGKHSGGRRVLRQAASDTTATNTVKLLYIGATSRSRMELDKLDQDESVAVADVSRGAWGYSRDAITCVKNNGKSVWRWKDDAATFNADAPSGDHLQRLVGTPNFFAAHALSATVLCAYGMVTAGQLSVRQANVPCARDVSPPAALIYVAMGFERNQGYFTASVADVSSLEALSADVHAFLGRLVLYMELGQWFLEPPGSAANGPVGFLQPVGSPLCPQSSGNGEDPGASPQLQLVSHVLSLSPPPSQTSPTGGTQPLADFGSLSNWHYSAMGSIPLLSMWVEVEKALSQRDDITLQSCLSGDDISLQSVEVFLTDVFHTPGTTQDPQDKFEEASNVLTPYAGSASRPLSFDGMRWCAPSPAHSLVPIHHLSSPPPSQHRGILPNHHATTLPPRSHCRGTFPPPSHHLPTTFPPPPSHHLPTTFPPPSHHLPTTFPPPSHHRPTTSTPPSHHLPTTFPTIRPHHLPDHLPDHLRPPSHCLPTTIAPTTFPPSPHHLPIAAAPSHLVLIKCALCCCRFQSHVGRRR